MRGNALAAAGEAAAAVLARRMKMLYNSLYSSLDGGSL